MATNDTKTTSSTATNTGTAGEGTGITTKSTNTAAGGASGSNVVAPPTDAKAGEPQAGTIGAADTANQQADATAAKQTTESAGYPLRVIVSNHTHEGQQVKKGSTIAVDIATYRWALENKIGEPGNKEDVGLDVTKKGEVIKPETDEEFVARFEAEHAAKTQPEAAQKAE